MKISELLAFRKTLIRQTTLANMAHAYVVLQRFEQRIARGELRGSVHFQRVHDPANATYWCSLTALEGNQSVLDEHFTEEDLVELGEALPFALDRESDELDFRLEEFSERFVEPLRHQLTRSGIENDVDAASSKRRSTTGEPSAG